MLTCTNCGRENPEDASFCGHCGSPLGNAAGSAREERKVVTVLFADLVGFTSRSERLDPEDVRATLTPYFARLREELERRGGTVEKFIGDAVMAVFGAPAAHEDDPERAVRAALAIRDAMAEMNEQDPDFDLHVRVGVNTGEALVSLGVRPQQGEGMAAGDVVNTAARLQTAAPVDGILVGETAYRATERAIEYRDAAAIEAKGKAEPVLAWEAVEARSRYGIDITRRVDTSLVGRDHELTLLRDALDRARHQDEPQLVTLVGEPGIGKSRLVHELFVHIEGMPELIAWRQGRCLPYGEGVSYWALGEMVKAEAGILETDPDGEAAAKLHRTVAELIPDADERGWVARHLGPLVGLAQERGSSQEGSEEAAAAWRRFLESLAERRPTVLIFEDLHWADDGLLDFLDYLIDWTRDVPLLVLCTARPELLARKPDWGGGKLNTATISLAPLSDEETARLLAGLLDRTLLPAELQATLLARAGGNPLYAEEFARMAANRSTADLATVELPGSVQGIIAARLDGLGPEAKSLLQDASVVGKTFWLGAVAAIGGQDPTDLERRLHELERGRFVRRARRSSVGAETEYAFLHLLVRDVAYGQIPRGARANKHRAAAAWIDSLGGERLEDRAELLAHHYLSALELARAAGQDTTDMERPARLALRAAGDRALGLAAFGAADRAYEAAVELWPVDDPERPLLLYQYGRSLWLYRDTGADVLGEARDGLLAAGDVEMAALAELLIGDTVWRQGKGIDAQSHFDRAESLIEGRPASTEVAQAKAHLARYLMVTGRSIDAIRVGREALAAANALGEEDIRTFALNTVGTARVNLGDLGGLDEIEESIQVAEAANLPWHVSRGHINMGVSLFYAGEMVRALEVHTRNVGYAQRYGIQGGITWNKAEVAFDLSLVGRWDESLVILDAEIARMEAGVEHYLEVQHRQSRARIRLGRGDPDGALADADRGVEVGRAARDPQALLPALAERSRALFLIGRTEDAVASIQEILDSVDPKPAMDWAWWIVPAAIVFTEVGRAEEILSLGGEDLPSRWIQAGRLWASGDLSGAADRFEEIGSAPDEAYARVKEAERLIEAGRRAEAGPFLSRALELYRGMGATASIREAEQLLAPPA
ncbi:MAG TPA: adenylate/guanylate cyclase domain-containing protein [Actinomycetota bacterium]|nr:adenylate/guanylate cyclase domain-containing protein [Actinomycetota bacterium]